MPVSLRTIAPAEADIRLDRWFHRHFPNMTQGALQKMLRTGQIRLDGARVEANARLKPGQQLRIPPLPEAAAKPLSARPVSDRDAAALERMVIYRDASVIAIDKPQGLPVQGGPGITRHVDGMLDALRFGYEERPRLVHRLDKDTSGIMVVAKSQPAHIALSEAFATRDLDREYLALCWGLPAEMQGEVEGNIGRHPTDRKRMAVVERGGKTALTHYWVEEAFGTAGCLMRLKLATGRTHQIRVHLSHIGHPVMGDPVYLRRIPAAAAGLAKAARERTIPKAPAVLPKPAPKPAKPSRPRSHLRSRQRS
jgi:23S rRNA pseudouridine955/2504/2580 synthase